MHSLNSFQGTKCPKGWSTDIYLEIALLDPLPAGRRNLATLIANYSTLLTKCQIGALATENLGGSKVIVTELCLIVYCYCPASNISPVKFGLAQSP